MKGLPEDDIEGASDEELHVYRVIRVDERQGRERADRFVTNRLENASRSFVQKLFAQGYVQVKGQVIKPSYKVLPGDEIVLYSPEESEEFQVKPEAIPLQVVYEDECLLVVNKPAGMVVHPGHGHYRGTLVNALLYHLRSLPLFQEGGVRPGLVHRLDKDTSGLMVVGKTPEAMEALSGQFSRQESQREYTAIVWGTMSAPQGTVDAPLARDVRDRQRMAVCKAGEGKPAVTHWRVEEEWAYVTKLRCRLDTGRMHQIRVHMASEGHPLLYDTRYGGDQVIYGRPDAGWREFVRGAFKLCPRQALHASVLGFKHPESGEFLRFHAILPEDMQALCDYWVQGGEAYI